MTDERLQNLGAADAPLVVGNMRIFPADVFHILAVARRVRTQDCKVDRYDQRSQAVAVGDPMPLGQDDEPADFLDICPADATPHELALGQVCASLFIVAVARIIDCVVPEQRPAKQPPIGFVQPDDAIEALLAFIQMALVVIVTPRFRIAGTGPKLRFHKAFVIRRHSASQSGLEDDRPEIFLGPGDVARLW